MAEFDHGMENEQRRQVMFAMHDRILALTARAEAAEAEVARLREVLTPFARIADHTTRHPSGSTIGVNIDRLRDARKALGETP